MDLSGPALARGRSGQANSMLAMVLAVALVGGCGSAADGSALERSAGEATGSTAELSGGGEGADTKPRPAGQVTFPSGRVFYVDLAISLREQMRGYMGRQKIGPDEGLLFVYRGEGIHKFWMKNCLTPIDMIWLDRQGRVIAIEHSAPPCREDPCPDFGPDRPSFSVLEVAPGVAREEGLETGDQLAIVTDHPLP